MSKIQRLWAIIAISMCFFVLEITMGKHYPLLASLVQCMCGNNCVQPLHARLQKPISGPRRRWSSRSLRCDRVRSRTNCGLRRENLFLYFSRRRSDSASLIGIRKLKPQQDGSPSGRKGIPHGYQRASLLGAFFNGVFLLALAVSQILMSFSLVSRTSLRR